MQEPVLRYIPDINTGNDASRQETILMEVMLANQKQDNIMAEMRNIDMQLSEQYKSLIEIVAQMSVLQRRRVQVFIDMVLADNILKYLYLIDFSFKWIFLSKLDSVFLFPH